MTNPPDPGKETRIVDVRGRSIVVTMLTDAQTLLMAREARLASDPNTVPARRMTAVARLFDILESRIVQESDREFCVELAVQGDLELKDMISFMDAFLDDEDKPKVRRGRATTKRSQQ